MPTFLHSSLTVGATCPICKQVYSPPEQTPGLSVIQAQYTPTTTGIGPNLRQTIGSVNGFRNPRPSSTAVSSGTPGITSSLKDTLFGVRIAYASYLPQKGSGMPPQIMWELYNPDWIARIPSTVPLTYYSFKTKLLKQGEDQHLEYITRLCSPIANGKWLVSTNHLETKNPIPRIWSQWKDEILIGDALTRVDYPPVSKKVTERPPYAVTLLWYPDQETDEPLPPHRARSVNTISTDELLEPTMETDEYFLGLQATARARAALEAPPETSEASEATPVPTRSAADSGHKRQISEAIPSNERANGTLEEGQTEQEGSRRSARPRKPKLRH